MGVGTQLNVGAYPPAKASTPTLLKPLLQRCQHLGVGAYPPAKASTPTLSAPQTLPIRIQFLNHLPQHLIRLFIGHLTRSRFLMPAAAIL